MITGIQAYQRNENISAERSEDRRIQGISNQSRGRDKTENTVSDRRQDRVSLSGEVQSAKIRESLGLPITGKITKDMLENSHKTIRETVNARILQSRTEAGIPEDAEITVRITEKGSIKVSSKAGGAWEMEKSLQEDASFKTAFASLGVHDRMQDYISRQRQPQNLFSDTEEQSLSRIAREYTMLRQGTDPLTSLVSQMQNQNGAFSLKHGGNTLSAA